MIFESWVRYFQTNNPPYEHSSFKDSLRSFLTVLTLFRTYGMNVLSNTCGRGCTHFVAYWHRKLSFNAGQICSVIIILWMYARDCRENHARSSFSHFLCQCQILTQFKLVQLLLLLRSACYLCLFHFCLTSATWSHVQPTKRHWWLKTS